MFIERYEIVNSIPRLRSQNILQMAHGIINGDIDILGAAPTASEVYGPAANKGIGDLVGLEEGSYKARCEAQVKEVGGVRWVIEFSKAVRIVNLSHRGQRRQGFSGQK